MMKRNNLYKKEANYMNYRNFTIAISKEGDWEALYMDGKLIAEGHSLGAHHVLDALADVLPNKVEYMEITDEKAEEGMPERLNDLKI